MVDRQPGATIAPRSAAGTADGRQAAAAGGPAETLPSPPEQVPADTTATTIPKHDWARTRDIIISIIGIGLILYVIGLILRNFIQTVLIFIVASLVAFALTPIVNAITARGIPRWLSITLVYVGLFCLIGFGGWWIGTSLSSQLSGLSNQFPQYLTRLQGFLKSLQDQLARHGLSTNLQDQLNGLTTGLQTAASGILGQSLKIVTGLTTAVIAIVLVVFFSIYLVADSHRISQNAPRVVPRRYQRLVRFVEVSVSQKVGGFIRGQIVMAIIIAVTTGVGAWILGVHFPLVLGVLAFFFELIPTIGPILIGISLAIVAVFQSIGLLITVLVFYIILHTIESNVLGPRIVGSAVGLPPFVSLIAIIAGAEVGGILGALFAVPATALFVSLVGAAIEEWKDQPPPPPSQQAQPAKEALKQEHAPEPTDEVRRSA